MAYLEKLRDRIEDMQSSVTIQINQEIKKIQQDMVNDDPLLQMDEDGSPGGTAKGNKVNTALIRQLIDMKADKTEV
jgi:hypothetical protein